MIKNIQLIVVLFSLCVLINYFDYVSSECVELTEFECKDGSCIRTDKVCNGRDDCSNGEDEIDCDYRLCREPKWYRCSDNQTCIGSGFLCDGLENCPAGDDEENCKSPHMRAVCNKFEFTCSDKTCIPLDMICDGRHDCPDKSDETIGCTNIENRCKGYLCKNKICLESRSWVCDGHDDCGDGSDEAGCTYNCKLEEHKFLCKNNESCISMHNVCNGKEDCLDKSDEHDLCENSTVKCTPTTCPQPSECLMLPTGPTCVCPKGFYFETTRKRCLDIDECKTFGICSQGCKNIEGSYKCTCEDKFKLKGDGKTCEVKNGEPLLLYTTQKTVVGVYLKSRHVYQVAQNLSQVIGVSYDGANIYWTDIKHNEESIVRALEDGSKQEIILTSGLEAPEDLAIDWLTGNIYFTDNIMKHIAVCSNHGYVCTSLVVLEVDQPRGIALHPSKGVMYWTDWGKKAHIAIASMDGEGAHALVDTDVHWPNGITLDVPNDRLYWVDAKMGRIESTRLDGTDRRTILNDILKHPYGIAVFEEKLFWSDWSTKSIHSCHKFTGKHHEVIVKDTKIYDVHIYHSAIQPKTNHSCLNNKCSHLCLLAVNNSFKCACPEDMILDVDYLTCRKITKKQKLYFGIDNYIVEMEHTTFGRHKMGYSTPLSLYVHKLAFDSLNGTIFIADNVQRMIYQFEPSTTKYSVLARSDIGNISALCFDHLANNLYWSDSDRRTIEVMSLNNQQRAIVHHFLGSDVPISMAVIPEAGKMFVALTSGLETHIDILNLNGRGSHYHVAEDKIGSLGIQFLVDPDSETVFWLDTQYGKIEFTNYEGSFRHLFRSRLNGPSSMTIIGEDVMWTSYKSPRVYWTHKSNLGSIKKFELDKPPYMSFPDNIQILSSKPLYVNDHKCKHNNGDCSHVCVSMGKFTADCLCPPGLVFKNNQNKTCIDALDCEFKCDSGECLTSSRRCNGKKDCVDGSDEKDCSSVHSSASKKICSYDQFACHDGTQCINNEARCDKVLDCKDKSDEDDCEHFDFNKKCRKQQHACDNGRCIDITALCDGADDCGDNSDENFCRKSENFAELCGANAFVCVIGQCIPKEWECDGHIDCIDGSDENDKCVSIECPEGSVKCKMGQCIDSQLVCDGHNDCGDNSDEFDCMAKTHKDICPEEDFQCTSDPTRCLDIKVKCNGTAECPRGEDEVGCSGCSFYEFQCDDKSCIRAEFRCDKQKDCNDGSDEINCQNYNTSLQHQFTIACQDDMFDCGDGTCIDQLRVCDKTADCKNGRDENSVCETACLNSPCEHKCTPSPHGAVCSCRSGYKLSGNKKSCDDIDECVESNPCAQTCENTEGSYRCGCYGGFLLRSDKTSCKSIEKEHFLLFTSFSQIRKLSENPSLLKIISPTNDSKINGMDVDVGNKKMYYSLQDVDAIYEYDLDLDKKKELYNPGKKEKLAVDWITRNIYAIDYSGFYSIKVCNFEKYACSRIIRFTNRESVKALAVDAVNRFIFYAIVYSRTFENSQSAIYKAGLDGAHKELIVSKASYVAAMECDTYKKQLYFIDAHSKTLQYVNYNGGNIKVIIRRENAITNPSGLTIFENMAFIINIGSPEAVKCQLYGDNHCKAFNLNVYNAEEVVAVAPSRQRKMYNVCETNRCSLICVQAELGSKCLCREGQIVQSDVLCPSDSDQNNFEQATDNAIDKDENSSGGTLAACLITIAVILFALGGYMYYRKIAGKENLTVNMHFHNPLSRMQRNSDTDRSEYNKVKFYRPIQRLLQGGRVSEISMDLKSEHKSSALNANQTNQKNSPENSDDESGIGTVNFGDDSWSRLVN